MAQQIKCPRCSTVQPRQPVCVNCKLDFRKYAAYLKKKYTVEGESAKSPAPPSAPSPPAKINCPRCKTPQPRGAKLCSNCKLDFQKYAAYMKKKRAAAAAFTKEAPPEPPHEHDEGPVVGMSAHTRSMMEVSTGPLREELSDIGELFEKTWETYKSRVGVLLGLYFTGIAFVLLLILLFAGITVGVSFLMGAENFIVTAVVGSIGALFVLLGIVYGMSAYTAAATDERIGFSAALSNGRFMLWPLFWILLSQSYLVGGGSMLLLVPGLIFYVWFSSAFYLIFCEEEKGMAAIMKSKAYVEGRFWPVAGRLILIIAAGMAAGMIPVFGAILFTPFMSIYRFKLYEELRDIKGPGFSLPEEIMPGFKWLLIATVGNILPIVLIVMFVMPLVKEKTSILKQTQALLELQKQQTSPELWLDRTEFAPGQQIDISFTVPESVADHAWIGILPASTLHGNEQENAYARQGYQDLAGRTGGSLTFLAPDEPGEYDFRLNDADLGVELKSVRFTILDVGVANAQPSVRPAQRSFPLGSPAVIDYMGLPGNQNDVVSIVRVGVPDDVPGDLKYTKGSTEGRLEFELFEPGSYEARVYYDWPRGGTVVRARGSFEVKMERSQVLTGDPLEARRIEYDSSITPGQILQGLVNVESTNYVGTIFHNGKVFHEVTGEMNRSASFGGQIPLEYGPNRIEFSLIQLGGGSPARLTFSVRDTMTGQAMARWTITGDPGAKQTFELLIR